MTIVEDESVDQAIIKELINRGLELISIQASFAGIKDSDVLKIAVENRAFLITEDKDFGEIAFRFQSQHHGILLIRINDLDRNVRTQYVCDLIEKYFEEMINNFTVISSNRLKIRKVKRKKNLLNAKDPLAGLIGYQTLVSVPFEIK